jgi:hypothetical protein
MFASVLRKSNELAGLEAVAQSWFEDDPHVAEAVERARNRDRAKLAAYLLQSVITRHRDRWANIVLRTAPMDAQGPCACRKSNPDILMMHPVQVDN